MTTNTDKTVYEAELAGDPYIQVFDDNDEAVGEFSCLPEVYDAALEAEGWKRVSDWNERGICKVISIAD